MTGPRRAADGEPRGPSDGDDPRLVSLQSLRKTIGYVGLGLPIAMLVGALIIERCLRTSMSAYYHIDNIFVHGAFLGGLVTLGVVLISYRGYARKPHEVLSDRVVMKIAGLGAIGVAIFPTGERYFRDIGTGQCGFRELACGGDGSLCEGNIALPPEVQRLCEDGGLCWPSIFGGVHYLSAAVFFGMTILICWVLFTRTKPDETPTPEKLARNRVYRISALVIAICAALIVIENYLVDGREVTPGWWPFAWLPSPIFWFEAVAVWAVALAWLVKAETLLGDPERDPSPSQTAAPDP